MSKIWSTFVHPTDKRQDYEYLEIITQNNKNLAIGAEVVVKLEKGEIQISNKYAYLRVMFDTRRNDKEIGKEYRK